MISSLLFYPLEEYHCVLLQQADSFEFSMSYRRSTHLQHHDDLRKDYLFK